MSPDPSKTRRGFFALLWVAIVLLAVGIAVVLNPGPRWKVARHQAAFGNVLVDENPIPADDVRSLEDALVPGSTIEWNGSGALELVSRRFLAISIAPGTRMMLPPPPPRWFARTSKAALESGRLAFAAGPRLRGARITIATPETTVVLTGSALVIVHGTNRTEVQEVDAAWQDAVHDDLWKGGD